MGEKGRRGRGQVQAVQGRARRGKKRPFLRPCFDLVNLELTVFGRFFRQLARAMDDI